MKKLLSLFLLFLSACISFAQTQQGLVKTNGRPNKPGTPLGNVVIKASGRSSSLSANDGAFSIAMSGLKGGEAFFLTSVTKLGYELADKNSIGRKYAFSASVPMVLSMVSKADMEADKQRIRNNAIVATQKKYEKRVEELEKQLEAQTITADAFGNQLQELQTIMDKYNELVENLADKYARTDYDQIDSIDQKINQAIEEGLFDEADSLIQSKGDINQRHQKALEWSKSSKKQKESLDLQIAQWENSEVSRLKELENLAEDYYHSYTIEVSRMHPEEAIKWLEKRAELDPERFEWLMEVGIYYKIYLAKYDKAMECFNRALKIAQKTKQPSHYISVFIEQGGIYARLQNTPKAEKCNYEALRYAKSDSKEYILAIASIYNNLGYLESQKHNYDKALEYYNKSLNVAPDTLLETATTTYANIATIYIHKYQLEKGDEYLEKAIKLAIQRENKLALSSLYSNKGVRLSDHGKDNEALIYYEKALAIEKEIFPPCHPSIASTLTNIATVYRAMSRTKERLANISQALDIYQKTYGEKHPEVARCYGMIANIFSDAGLYDRALTFANKSWEINSTFYTETSEEYASHCNSLGLIYDGLKNDSLALSYYMKSKQIAETLGLNKAGFYYSSINNIATMLTKQKKYEEALEYTRKYLEIVSSIKGRENDSYILGLNNLANIYFENGNIDTAIKTFHEAENLTLKVYGKWHKQLCYNYSNTGSLFLRAKEYDKARDYFQKCIDICDSIYDGPAELTMIAMSNMAMTYYNDSKWKETIPWIEKAAAMRMQIDKEAKKQLPWHSYIYNCYYELAKGGQADDIERFKECQDSLWYKVRINPGGEAEKKYGLHGEYMLLQYCNWEHGCMQKFEDEIIRMKEVRPVDMIVYRDGKIEKLHFEEQKIGVTYLISLMDKKESQTINDAYAKWKNENTEK